MEFLPRKCADLESELSEVREEALSVRKYITDAKNKLQAEELKKTAKADAVGTLERRS